MRRDWHEVVLDLNAALQLAPRRADLLVSALAAIGRRYEAWMEHGPGAVVAAFGKRDHLAGATVTLGTATGELVGTACGIDDLGRHHEMQIGKQVFHREARTRLKRDQNLSHLSGPTATSPGTVPTVWKSLPFTFTTTMSTTA